MAACKLTPCFGNTVNFEVGVFASLLRFDTFLIALRGGLLADLTIGRLDLVVGLLHGAGDAISLSLIFGLGRLQFGLLAAFDRLANFSELLIGDSQLSG
jgi:hypothetical protein